MLGRRRIHPEGARPDPYTKWWRFKQKVARLRLQYANWRYRLPHDPVLDIIYFGILIRRMIRKDCLDAAKLHQKWAHCTPLSLSRREMTVLHAETMIFPFDPLFGVDEFAFQAFPCEPYIANNRDVIASGLGRTIFLLGQAGARYRYQRNWNGAKPSHVGDHVETCLRGECSAVNPHYWEEHPERVGYDGFAENDACVEARWMAELADPRFPLPPGFSA